jgi:hypothetical protein
VGIPAKREDLLANNPEFKPNLLYQIQKQQHEGIENDEMYGKSNLFKGNWRDRKQTRYGQGADENNFADNLDEDDPLTRRRQKSVIADGLFGATDMKDEDEGTDHTPSLPGGLFDDSDEERELKQEMQESQQVKNAEKPKGLFDIAEEDEAPDFAEQKKEDMEKKAKKFLDDSEDEDEFKPVQRAVSIHQKTQAPVAPPQKKAGLFGESDEEEDSFKPPVKAAPREVAKPPQKRAVFGDSDEDEEDSFKPAPKALPRVEAKPPAKKAMFEEDSDEDLPAAKPQVQKPAEPKRDLKKVMFGDQEDSDDEDIGIKKPPPQKAAAKPNFLDDEDEDDDDFAMPSSKRPPSVSKRPPSISMRPPSIAKNPLMERKKSRLLDDDSDDDDFAFKKPEPKKQGLPDIGMKPPGPKKQEPPGLPKLP